MRKILEPGITYGADRAEYVWTTGVAPSRLKNILKSPATVKAMQEKPFEPSSAMRIGSALAHLLEGGDDLLKEHCWIYSEDDPTGNSKEAKAFRENRDAWIKDGFSRYWLTVDEHKTAKGMYEAVTSDVDVMAHLEGSKQEVAAVWDHPCGQTCKALADYFNPQTQVLTEVKSCSDISESARERAIANFSYHLQAWMLTEGFMATEHWFLWVQSSAPFEVVLEKSSADLLDVGRYEFEAAVQLFRDCKENDFWPKRQSLTGREAQLPRWYKSPI